MEAEYFNPDPTDYEETAALSEALNNGEDVDVEDDSLVGRRQVCPTGPSSPQLDTKAFGFGRVILATRVFERRGHLFITSETLCQLS